MLQVNTTNRILIDGKPTGLVLVQRASGTVIYTPENKIAGIAYREHQMPEQRYSAAHDAPASGVAGCAKLEADIRLLLASLKD